MRRLLSSSIIMFGIKISEDKLLDCLIKDFIAQEGIALNHPDRQKNLNKLASLCYYEGATIDNEAEFEALLKEARNIISDKLKDGHNSSISVFRRNNLLNNFIFDRTFNEKTNTYVIGIIHSHYGLFHGLQSPFMMANLIAHFTNMSKKIDSTIHNSDENKKKLQSLINWCELHKLGNPSHMFSLENVVNEVCLCKEDCSCEGRCETCHQ